MEALAVDLRGGLPGEFDCARDRPAREGGEVDESRKTIPGLDRRAGYVFVGPVDDRPLGVTDTFVLYPSVMDGSSDIDPYAEKPVAL